MLQLKNMYLNTQEKKNEKKSASFLFPFNLSAFARRYVLFHLLHVFALMYSGETSVCKRTYFDVRFVVFRLTGVYQHWGKTKNRIAKQFEVKKRKDAKTQNSTHHAVNVLCVLRRRFQKENIYYYEVATRLWRAKWNDERKVKYSHTSHRSTVACDLMWHSDPLGMFMLVLRGVIGTKTAKAAVLNFGKM